MSLSGRARDHGFQSLHYFRKRMRFNDVNFAAGIKIGRMPARSFLMGIFWFKETAFNSSSSDTVQIGSTQGGSDILAATDVHSTGFTSHGSAAGLGTAVTFIANEIDLWVKWNATTANTATTGDATVIILYCPDNDL